MIQLFLEQINCNIFFSILQTLKNKDIDKDNNFKLMYKIKHNKRENMWRVFFKSTIRFFI